MAKDYYAILGVSKTSSDAEIKQAYRKLSRELHPDKHKGDKTKESKFKEVNEAYEVLSDPKKKANYDRFGSADFGGMGGGQGSGGFGGFQGFDPSQFSDIGDLGDLFESFFGGSRGRGRADTRGRNVQVEITIPFMEAVTGSERSIEISGYVECKECGGKGTDKGSKLVECRECSGTGAVSKATRSLFGTIRQSVVCSVCHGSGKVPEHPCKNCRGEGRVKEKRTVTIRIPAGIDEGQTLRLTGEGEAGQQGSAAGDLLVQIHVQGDPKFRREGDDVRSDTKVSIADAALGAEIDVETVQGKVSIHVPPGTQPGQVLKIKGKGMPVLNSNKHGDHYVMVEVEVPTKLSKEQRRLFEELKKF